jgi:hypothetical protein
VQGLGCRVWGLGKYLYAAVFTGEGVHCREFLFAALDGASRLFGWVQARVARRGGVAVERDVYALAGHVLDRTTAKRTHHARRVLVDGGDACVRVSVSEDNRVASHHPSPPKAQVGTPNALRIAPPLASPPRHRWAPQTPSATKLQGGFEGSKTSRSVSYLGTAGAPVARAML